MSAIGSNPGSRRPRPVLIRAGVPSDQLRGLVEELASEQVRMVDTVFDALCAAGSPDPDEQVSTVFMAPPPAGLDELQVLEAFRGTNPDVRIVLLLPVEDGSRAETAMEAGFNDAVSLPASVERIRNAVRMVRGEVEDPEHRSSAALDREEVREPDGRSIVEIVLEEACTRIEQEASMPRPQTTGAQHGSLAEQGEIGDTRLVHALLEGEHVETIAIELIRKRSGIESLEMVMERIETLPGSGSVDSCLGGWTCVPIGEEEALGFLASETANEAVLAPWCRWLRHWIVLQNQHADYRRKAWTDELTGSGNRRALNRVLDEVIERARPELRAVTVMFFDIDNFKTYNDRFGHDAGDEVLRETVQLLRSVIRRGDHVFRVGGDEFVVIFAPDPSGPRSPCSSPPDSIEQIVARFQQQVRTLQLPRIGLEAPGTLSISAGMATYPWDGRTSEELLHRADQLALESKRSGKNLITFGPAAGKSPEGYPDAPGGDVAGTDFE